MDIDFVDAPIKQTPSEQKQRRTAFQVNKQASNLKNQDKSRLAVAGGATTQGSRQHAA
eukprot:CAMPEP_0170513360 /NCGR_PEP_ID=MMETSP0208-20121228/67356_1 /TAXON_ID=197538 /ORGANISM="Strombidium inclinatum, Strain S3" /LENGTH=57 /DNA_ID=CAMNT_0010797085 /DNA_START=2202 /DNA_END=2375 /DNA_ORIENTATION=+